MEARAPPATLLFEGFRLDRRGLFRLDERGVFVPVAIGSRALDVLRMLMRADGDLVSKDEIRAAVWPGTVVGDNNLGPDLGAAPRPRSGAAGGKPHSDGRRARLPLCGGGDSALGV